MNEQIRAEFEREFPPSINSEFNANLNQYSWESHPDSVHPHNDLWLSWQAAHARYAGSESEAVAVRNLEMLVKRLCAALNRAEPSNALSSEAMDYLRRSGIYSAESALRANTSPAPAVPADAYEMAAAIVDLILKDATLLRLPDEDGKSPTYCMGLGNGGTLMKVSAMLTQATKESDK